MVLISYTYMYISNIVANLKNILFEYFTAYTYRCSTYLYHEVHYNVH